MEEKGAFFSFVSKVANMPHIANKVMDYLAIDDVVHCLRTNKAMRTFLLGALKNNTKLQGWLDSAATGRAAGSDSLWKSGQRINLEVSEDVAINEQGLTNFNSSIFGLDDKVWVSSCLHKPSMKDERTTLDIHNLQGSVDKSVSLCGFPKWEVIASGQVLVSDGREVLVIKSSAGQVQSKVAYKHKQKRKCYTGNDDFLEKDSLHDYVSKTEGGKQDCLKMFSDQDGLPNPRELMLAEETLNTFLKEVISYIKIVLRGCIMENGTLRKSNSTCRSNAQGHNWTSVGVISHFSH